MAIMILWKLFAPFAPVGAGNAAARAELRTRHRSPENRVEQGIIFATLWMEMSFLELTPD